MTRKEARNQAFILIFEKSINGHEIDEILEAAKECRDFAEDEDGYTKKVFIGVFDNIDAIDDCISQNLSGWTLNRISKVSLAILRLAIFGIRYMDDIPASVSINEAVELAKKYATKEDAAFVNGILSTIAKTV